MAKTDKTAVKETNTAEETTQEMVQDYEILFDEKAKAEAFDKLADLYYQHNFGSIQKSDIDLLMFHLYLNGAEELSDYEISKNLGITQQRVRNLRVKRQLKYAPNFDWKAKFAELLVKTGNYDEKTRRVSLPVTDPNLFIEIENVLEGLGGFIDYQLNKKILTLRVEYYLELVAETIKDEEKRQEVKRMLKKRSGNKSLDPKNRLQDLITLVTNITGILPYANPMLQALKTLLLK